tara:strand:- start:312 stop:710 length:399 start_codon:yes stop_codon:yes gene_type:complete
MDKLIKFLEEMIEASEKATIPLDMGYWYCGSSCCLIGDLTVYRDPGNASSNTACIELSNELDDLFEEVLEEEGLGVAESIYGSTYMVRRTMAYESDFFTFEEMQHPHLNEDHNNRAFAINFINLIIRKLEKL